MQFGKCIHHPVQGQRGVIGAIVPIDFEKFLTAPINFRWKQGSKGILHPSIEILNGLLGILHPSIEIPNDAPGLHIRYLARGSISLRIISSSTARHEF